MARFLIMGALIAATIQTFVPASIADRVATLPVLSLLAMMFLAFILSLCSESDAFVAASFTAFGPSAQLAFLVFGPMVDLKLGALYVGTYSKGFFRTVLIVVTAVTLVGDAVGRGDLGMSAVTASVAERWSPRGSRPGSCSARGARCSGCLADRSHLSVPVDADRVARADGRGDHVGGGDRPARHSPHRA